MPEIWHPRVGVQRSRCGGEIILVQVLEMAGEGGGDQCLMALAEVCLAGSKCHFGSCPGCGHTVFLPVFCVWFSSFPHDSVSELIHSFLLNHLELVSGASN